MSITTASRFTSVNLKEKSTFLTSKHHHVLEVSFDLVPSAQVEQEGERVDVEGSADEDGDLTREVRSV